MPTSPINSSPPKLQPVILVARPAAGGIRSHLISLLTRLDRTKFAVTLAAPHSLINGLPGGLPAFNTFDLAILSQTTPLDIVAALQLTELIKSIPGAIVHAHGVRAGFVCSLARQINSFCLVVTHHNIPPRGSLSRFVLELIDFGCAATVAVSNAIAIKLPGTDTTVIPNGIEISDYGKYSRCEAKAHFGLTADEFICAFLGRLSREKGADLIVRTALMRPDIKFLVGGDGPEKERLVRSCPPNVKLLGRIPDPTLLLSAADVLLIPSRTEGQGMVALEAMASGTPVIASRVGGLIETVDLSHGGILVDPESSSQMASAIDQLRNDSDLGQKLADSGKAWVTEHGRIEDRIAEIEALYQSLG